jgi:hypothetical protein
MEQCDKRWRLTRKLGIQGNERRKKELMRKKERKEERKKVDFQISGGCVRDLQLIQSRQSAISSSTQMHNQQKKKYRFRLK